MIDEGSSAMMIEIENLRFRALRCLARLSYFCIIIIAFFSICNINNSRSSYDESVY